MDFSFCFILLSLLTVFWLQNNLKSCTSHKCAELSWLVLIKGKVFFFSCLRLFRRLVQPQLITAGPGVQPGRPHDDREWQRAGGHGAGALGQWRQQTHPWKRLQDLSAGVQDGCRRVQRFLEFHWFSSCCRAKQETARLPTSTTTTTERGLLCSRLSTKTFLRRRRFWVSAQRRDDEHLPPSGAFFIRS